jgi:Branched-chain amino acid aminotransferase/4-amino-4-deoxychorismate lyase
MSPEPLANWNGVEMPLSEVRVSVLDRGFLFGDAIYEVIRVYYGKPFLYEDHMARLARNLQKMKIPADPDRISERVLSTLAHSQVQSGTIYIQVTRGEAPRVHHFPRPVPAPNELIYVKSLDDPYASRRETGGRVKIIEDIRWKRCDIKSTNLLANCMGAEEAYAEGYDEAVYAASDGTLVEATRSSLFGVKEGAIITAPLSDQILPGITRKLILRLADEINVPVIQESIHRNSLSSLEELFLTGTTMEILPIVLVETQTIGTGTPGPIAQRLHEAYRAAIERECR